MRTDIALSYGLTIKAKQKFFTVWAAASDIQHSNRKDVQLRGAKHGKRKGRVLRVQEFCKREKKFGYTIYWLISFFSTGESMRVIHQRTKNRPNSKPNRDNNVNGGKI